VVMNVALDVEAVADLGTEVVIGIRAPDLVLGMQQYFQLQHF